MALSLSLWADGIGLLMYALHRFNLEVFVSFFYYCLVSLVNIHIFILWGLKNIYIYIAYIFSTKHLRIDTGALDVIGVIEYISCSP